MKNISMRDAFFNRIYEIASKDRDVIVISADMGAPALDKYRKDMPEQFLNVGIAEQNLVTVATGLSLEGKKVYIYAIMPFVTLRCYEFLKVDLSLMNLPITVVGVGSGFSYTDSGPTHHATEDITIMRVLPGMTIFNSTDSIMADKLACLSYRTEGPSYVRLDREILPDIYDKNESFKDGLKVLKKGKDICIVSTGNMVHKAMEISQKLKEHKITAAVVDFYRIKPANVKMLLKTLKKSGKVVTIEEHLLAGGLGSLVAEIMADNGVQMPLRRFGLQDKYYYEYGGRENIQKVCNIGVQNILNSILKGR